MLKKVVGSFVLSLNNIRSHFFHTLLSVLGIVIGVAALVAILSLIDGMEQYARDQITRTTSLKAIVIQTDQYKWVNEVRIKKDTFAIISYEDYLKATAIFAPRGKVYCRASFPGTVSLQNEGTVGTLVTAVGKIPAMGNEARIEAGVLPRDQDIIEKSPFAVVNSSFVRALRPAIAAHDLVGENVVCNGQSYQVRAVVHSGDKESARLFVPISLFSPQQLRAFPPEMLIESNLVEDVPMLKAQAIGWLKGNFPGRENDFVVQTNDVRVAQATKGIRLFRVVMALIVGISVLVGGIGVMNVLLISVTERTVEIGIRKAVGASRRDIILQFLSESVTISVFGSVMGLIVGIAGTMAFVPLIGALTEIPFYATYTWNTLLVVSVLAVAVGIAFGTYPAIRAARLDPVEAIRRE